VRATRPTNRLSNKKTEYTCNVPWNYSDTHFSPCFPQKQRSKLFIHTTVEYLTCIISLHLRMLPCIVIDFFLNNQPDALIIPNLVCYKTSHVSGIFSAHHQEFSTVHSALVSFMQVSDDRFQAESGWLHPYNCRMYSRKLLMVGREYAQNM